jgi:hypothetical protein
MARHAAFIVTIQPCLHAGHAHNGCLGPVHWSTHVAPPPTDNHHRCQVVCLWTPPHLTMQAANASTKQHTAIWSLQTIRLTPHCQGEPRGGQQLAAYIAAGGAHLQVVCTHNHGGCA